MPFSRVASLLPGALFFMGLAVCTWVSFRLGQGFAFTGFLYLILVVLSARYGGFWLATAISLVAVTCLNYYFVPPIFSFANSPANWVALGAFEFTALTISRLSLRAHLQATAAAAGRRDMERLYETSRRILLLDPSGEPEEIAALIREIFELDCVDLFDAQSGKTYRNGESLPGTAQQARETYVHGVDRFEPQIGSWGCVLRLGPRLIGGLALQGAGMTKLAATALASLCGIALERTRTLQRESRAQAARQTEQLRTAVLDALAHEFKTPLTVARTASSGLLAVGGLSDFQEELVTVIDQQTGRLDHLVSRLLTAARLDSTEFKPQREPVLFSGLVGAAIQSLNLEADRARFRVSVPNGEIPVLSDRELVLTSLVQLVDNSIKYSEPGSPIDVHLTVKDKAVVLRMRSKGLVIAPDDRERIFERFYRAPQMHHLPSGSGLGLSIVKKIVEAHQGRVWAEGEMDYGTSFSISLPAAAR